MYYRAFISNTMYLFKRISLVWPACAWFLLVNPQCCFAQNPAPLTSQYSERPKLVVGIVVDQMRYDFLFRYRDKFGKGGFMRLLNEGFFCGNTHYNYVPTYTGPG